MERTHQQKILSGINAVNKIESKSVVQMDKCSIKVDKNEKSLSTNNIKGTEKTWKKSKN